MAHRALIRSLTSSLEAFFDQINQLRDVVLREVRHPVHVPLVLLLCACVVLYDVVLREVRRPEEAQVLMEGRKACMHACMH